MFIQTNPFAYNVHSSKVFGVRCRYKTNPFPYYKHTNLQMIGSFSTYVFINLIITVQIVLSLAVRTRYVSSPVTVQRWTNNIVHDSNIGNTYTNLLNSSYQGPFKNKLAARAGESAAKQANVCCHQGQQKY